MKILLVTYWGLTNMGGIWTYMNQLASRLEQQGYEVDLMGTDIENDALYILNKNKSFNKKEVREILREKTISNILTSYQTSHEQILSLEVERNTFELGATYLGIDQYDLIHAQDPISSYAISRILDKKIPLIASFHGSFAREMFFEYQSITPTLTWKEFKKTDLCMYYQSMEYLGAHVADRLIVSSYWIKKTIMELGIPTEKFRIVPYGINLNTYDTKSKVEFAVLPPLGKKVIMYTGRLEYIKGVQLLIEALGKLKKNRQDWVCWIVGEGSMRKELQSRCIQLDIQQDVVLWGEQENIPSILCKADIYVQPSLQDTQPFSVTEAQLAGIPCIVSNTTGMPEMIQHELTGWLTPPDNPELLCERIAFVLKHDHIRVMVGKHAKIWATEHRSLEVMFEATLRAYLELMHV
ncbi:glycosyltransferase family 4 protein [Paenibacillus sp. IHBB 10380]|uniref:glycosyltransferase family 4 protein n=1 Tax=Paenibacillus sp. IHBB 10380 TaxID=1566358 RepID=UPI0005CFD121|nr:glycosyltransferase family 4 protein [Paenibacillus sp. IHBB 10380]